MKLLIKFLFFLWDNINRLAAVFGVLLVYLHIALFIYVQYTAIWYIQNPQPGTLYLGNCTGTQALFSPIFQTWAHLILFSTWSDIARRLIAHDFSWHKIINRFLLSWQCLLPVLFLIAIFTWVEYCYSGIKIEVGHGNIFIETIYPFIWHLIIGTVIITLIYFRNKRKQVHAL